jgi:hypothetical protein
MRSFSTTVLATSIAMMALVATAAQAAVVKGAQGAQAVAGTALVPSGKGYAISPDGGVVPQSQIAGYGINYHGGPVMKAKTGVNVYVIWYGDWAAQGGPNAKAIVQDLLVGTSGSPYYGINTTYYMTSDTKKNRVKNKVNLMGQVDDVAKSLGSALTDANIRTLVSNALTAGTLPKDANGLYFVLTTKDVNETSGFCTQYCGWHTHASILSTDIKYSFVGDAARCISSCAAQTTKSPNNNPGVDGMASVILHELEETTSDPDLNAWWDNSGAENADKCAWTFGTTYDPGNGSMANMKLGARDFLIQRNWVNAPPSGRCDLHL